MQKKTKLYIVRHAETVGNVEKRLTGRKDYEITPNGQRMINELNIKLGNVKFDVAHASTEDRTYKTIKDLSDKNGLAVIRTSDLSEMYFGEYDGYTWDEVNKLNPNIKRVQNEINSIEGIKDQESMQEVADRMYSFMVKCCEENEGKTILIGSHGVAIEAFLRKVTGVPFSDERAKYSQHNTSVNVVNFDGEKFDIEIMADKSFKVADIER